MTEDRINLYLGVGARTIPVREYINVMIVVVIVLGIFSIIASTIERDVEGRGRYSVIVVSIFRGVAPRCRVIDEGAIVVRTPRAVTIDVVLVLGIGDRGIRVRHTVLDTVSRRYSRFRTNLATCGE